MSGYKALSGNLFSRKFGGTTKGVADPFISGYFFGTFESLPTAVASSVPGISAVNLIQAGLTSVTLPTANLNKTTLDGLGGNKWHVPAGIDIGDTCSLKFVEMSGLPYFQLFHTWFNLIRDIRTGVSQLSSYSKEAYAANFIYAATTPNGSTIEFACYMTGMFPTKDPFDIYGGDITAIDKVDYEQEFSVDYVWVNDKWVKDKAATLIKSAETGKSALIGSTPTIGI